MADQTCQVCGRPLPRRPGGRPGRASVYCSAACRQRAYRSRGGPTQGEAAVGLIAEIEKQVRGLEPQLPGKFYTEVTELSGSVGRLRRIARLARDVAQTAPVAADGEAPQSVTREGVTDSASVRELDEWSFASLVETHRRELQVHCYRMVGSYDDAEELVQDTFLRAWRTRDGFEGRSSVRTWLYRIATNACIDFQRRSRRAPQRYQPIPGMEHGAVDQPPVQVAWLQPYPDELLDEIASPAPHPDAQAVSRETIELVFLAAIQHLPARQRAVLILRDVLGWSAAETAALLETSVASVNSALQRAKPTLRAHLPEARAQWKAPEQVSAQEREVLDKYMAVSAAPTVDAAAIEELLREDVRLTMPPNPFWFVGREAMLRFVMASLDPASPVYFGQWRHLETRANRMPAVAGYVKRPGTEIYRAQMLDVLRIEEGRIAEITTFEPHLFAAFGLPMTL
ncbi:MAG TPA: sigma-70 family RNA polymerase sigma factor [Actinocrinis sp.]|jgi:RNA polymerase sigma-70 factor (ECF subfamily)